MKTNFIPTLLFTFLIACGFTFLNTKPKFSYKVYGNIANYFENEKEFASFFEFKKGDVVVEIGAGRAKNLAGLSFISDSVSFYAQDIDEKVLNRKSLNKVIDGIEKYKKPLTNAYSFCIGTEKESKLPDNTFDKILLVNTFHEFTFMNEMLKDVFKKLKAKGKLYILEADCSGKGHKNYKVDESISILEANGFKLIKHDEKNLNGGTGVYRLVLQKE